jgi:predicted nucleic acid-binding protein
MFRQPHSTFPTQTLIEHAFAITAGFGQTVYDSTYVALAVANRAPFITADERLLSALGPWFPMQWLGSL